MSGKVRDYIDEIDRVIARGKIKDSWDSLMGHPVPRWYRDAKFGIFIHWGVFSVPAFDNEWYPRNMYQRGSPAFAHHAATWGSQREFGYKDFVPLFRAEKFDPESWAELFAASGARFVMPVAEHHDGFQMYHSELSDWCASKMGPRRDTLGELSAAIERRGLTLAVSSHRIEHYWFLDGARDCDSDIPEEVPYGHLYWPTRRLPQRDRESVFVDEPVDPRFMEDWLARTCELVDRYRPRLVYFDWWIQIEPMKPYLRKFAAYYYNRALERGDEVAINYKYDAFQYTSAVQDIERGQMAQVSPDFWQTDTSVAKNSWCYTPGNEYRRSVEIIEDLVDVVSKNGSLLLNVGPRADGSIPDEDRSILEDIGRWLAVNGEGIYGTSHWKRFGEGPTAVPDGAFSDTARAPYTSEDFRFTFKGGFLYAFAMKWPEDGALRIRSLAKDTRLFTALIRSVEILGSAEPARFEQRADGLEIRGRPAILEGPVCVKMRLE